MNRTHARLAALSLVAGAVVTTAGYLSAFLVNGNGAERFAGSSWTSLYTLALLGDVLLLLGLPAILAAQDGRSPRLTLVGYVGVFVPLAILNVGEGAIEGFTKPYLADHGGVPAADLPGLALFEAPALLAMLVGVVCLGIAVLRARMLPRWVGVLFLAVPFLGAAGLPGGWGLLADYSLCVALLAVGVHVLRAPTTEQGDQSPAFVFGSTTGS